LLRSLIASTDFDLDLDFEIESFDVVRAIFILFNAFANSDFFKGDRPFADFVLTMFVSLFDCQNSLVERLICYQLSQLVLKVSDDSLHGILEPLAGFLARMFAQPTCESCRLVSCLAARESDDYAEFLIGAGIVVMFRQEAVLSEEMQSEVALVLQNFATCERMPPIEFLLDPDIVRFIQAVFDGGTFTSQWECLIVVVRLIQRGFVEQAMGQFMAAFACLPDLLGCSEEDVCAEVLDAMAIVLEGFESRGMRWVPEIREILGSEAMVQAFAAIVEKDHRARTILEAIEKLGSM
jgi:hypothetical protein